MKRRKKDESNKEVVVDTPERVGRRASLHDELEFRCCWKTCPVWPGPDFQTHKTQQQEKETTREKENGTQILFENAFDQHELMGLDERLVDLEEYNRVKHPTQFHSFSSLLVGLRVSLWGNFSWWCKQKKLCFVFLLLTKRCFWAEIVSEFVHFSSLSKKKSLAKRFWHTKKTNFATMTKRGILSIFCCKVEVKTHVIVPREMGPWRTAAMLWSLAICFFVVVLFGSVDTNLFVLLVLYCCFVFFLCFVFVLGKLRFWVVGQNLVVWHTQNKTKERTEKETKERNRKRKKEQKRKQKKEQKKKTTSKVCASKKNCCKATASSSQTVNQQNPNQNKTPKTKHQNQNQNSKTKTQNNNKTNFCNGSKASTIWMSLTDENYLKVGAKQTTKTPFSFMTNVTFEKPNTCNPQFSSLLFPKDIEILSAFCCCSFARVLWVVVVFFLGLLAWFKKLESARNKSHEMVCFFFFFLGVISRCFGDWKLLEFFGDLMWNKEHWQQGDLGDTFQQQGCLLSL